MISIISYLVIGHLKIGLRRDIISGFLVGASLLWSNDFAIPTAGIFSAFYIMQFYLNENFKWKKSVATFLLAAFSSWFFLILAITIGNHVELIKYNFVDVATDQWWYFGAYGSSTRVFEINQIFRIFSIENHFPLLALIATSVISLQTKRLEHVLLSIIGFILFAGGSLASIGGHLGGYFGAFYYWGAMTATLAALRVIKFLFIDQILKISKVTILRNNIQTIFLLISVIFAYSSFYNCRNISYLSKIDSTKYFSPDLEHVHFTRDHIHTT